ncbi:MAG: glutamate--tRNA ligase [Bacillota bacterium]|nr:glutamate--tRNA ligase [Bacillota bacterium]
MDWKTLAELLFPHISKTREDYEKAYPPRALAEGARVTRLGPSPTGFIHLGNLYGAFVDERLAHQSGGVFFLRIEDTDEKRQVEGAVEAVVHSLDYFGLRFDEGALLEGETGAYGPYFQRQRAEIYQCFAKWLVEQGKAYPCFCGEEELQEIRGRQEERKATPGYHGSWARCRELTLEEIRARLEAGQPFVLRFLSGGREHGGGSFEIEDGVRGTLSMPENFQDVVLLKQNGIPTYHFAHVVDDHLMRTTHVVRGEEWLSSLPIHVALFEAFGWPLPVYCHTTVLMKMEGENKRKLSKRKDPELSLNYYRRQGYHPAAVREYLLTILNSNYEEWRMANPEAPAEEFPFTTEKMSSSGTLFDLDKLNDVSKDTLVRIPSPELYEFLLEWAREYHGGGEDPRKEETGPEAAALEIRGDLASLFAAEKEKLLRILDMDRTGPKPRKDLVCCSQIFRHISYFFDEHYTPLEGYPETVPPEDLKPILQGYLAAYDPADNQSAWFDKIRSLASELGYAAKPKEYQKNPELYKGHVGDVSTVIRVALMGRRSSPNLWEIQDIMGEAQVRRRMEKALAAL